MVQYMHIIEKCVTKIGTGIIHGFDITNHLHIFAYIVIRDVLALLLNVCK